MSTLSNDFFKTSEYLPLIPKSETGCCAFAKTWRPGKKIKTVAIGGCITGSLLIGGFMSYITYDVINTLAHAPLSSKNSIFALSILAFEGALGTITACCASIGIKIIYQYRQNLDQYPHKKYYQGSTLISLDYNIQMERCLDRKICMPLLENYFKDLDKRGLLKKWMNCKRYASREAALEIVFKKMGRGLCHGYSLALLSMMRDYAESSSETLFDRFSFEQIYYFQFMRFFARHCAIYNDLFDLFAKYLIQEKNLPLTMNEHIHSISDFLLLRFLNVDSRNSIIKQISLSDAHLLDANQLRAVFIEKLNEIESFQKLNTHPCSFDSFTIAGIILLDESAENQKKKGKHYGHTLFFQFSNKHLRFHDSGSSIPGFFEFPKEELFFDGLISHIQHWPPFKDGKLNFIILGIPKNEINLDEVKIDIYPDRESKEDLNE